MKWLALILIFILMLLTVQAIVRLADRVKVIESKLEKCP